MAEIIYQNSDNFENNPIAPLSSTHDPKKNKLPPLTPKLIVLIILFSIVTVLFIISLFINQKSSSTSTATPSPTPLPVTKVTPQAQIPTQYQIQFNQIDELLNLQDIPSPPQIDQEIGI